MFTLILNKSRFYKIKRGQSSSLVQKTLGVPVCGKLYAGKIIYAEDFAFSQYKAKVGESYKSIAQKFGLDESELKAINGEKPVYPTQTIFLPINRLGENDIK